MYKKTGQVALSVWLAAAVAGCATQKESHTARTGVEQLLVSSAIDQSLDRVDISPLRNRKVFLETKFLDCVDKNYVIVALHQRLLAQHSKLVDKADDADMVLEVGSGCVGTDSQDLFIGVPEIPLPPPSPISIPKLAVFTRKKMNGTAKLVLVAYEAKTKVPVISAGSTLARSDQNTWNVLGTGTVQTGSVQNEIATATSEADFNLVSVANFAKKAIVIPAQAAPPATDIETAGHVRPAAGAPAPEDAACPAHLARFSQPTSAASEK